MKPLNKRARNSRTTGSERGQALIEMVFVSMFILVMTFGVIDLGRAIWQKEVITGLSREGSNLASRDTTLAASLAAVDQDGSVLNLTTSGCVIITAVQNLSGTLVITQQTPGCPGYKSKIGTGIGQVAILPAVSPVIPEQNPALNPTLYVTEIFTPYSPITPLGAFVNYTLPTTLYDVAYFEGPPQVGS